MLNRAFDLLSTMVIAGLLTSLVLPGRQTVGVINATFGGLTHLEQASMGTGK